MVVELGSGGGFANEVVPGLLRTDVAAAPGVDLVVDATAMPFADGSLRALLMMNVLHHIADVDLFLAEARRCLAVGGRLLIVDEFPGVPGRVMLKYFHHEGFDDTTPSWRLSSSGDANGALAWMIFFRDRAEFESRYPELRIAAITPHTAVRYWLSGGLKMWSLLPDAAFDAVSAVEDRVTARWPRFASFVDIELERR